MNRWFWGGLAALGMFLAAVHVMLATGRAPAGSGLVVDADGSTKVFVLVVDSMRPEDADNPRLRFLDGLRATGFRGEVDPCLDALTIPCVTEAFSGNSDAGLLGAYRNLLGAGGVAASSLFADVVASGRTTAIYSGGQYKAFNASFSESRRRDRRATRAAEREVAAKFVAEGHDLIVFHYPHLDEGAHHHAVGTAEYDALLDELQENASWILERLPAEYEVVVLGDHGHTRTGRHLFGLDVPTVFFSSARSFGPGTLPGRVPISTYRYLVGVPLGILPPLQYEGADLAERLVPGTRIAAAAADRAYAGLRDGGGHRLGVVLVALLAAVAACVVSPRSIRWWVGGGLVAAALYGLAYTDLIPVIHFRGWVKWKIESLTLLTGALAYAATRSARPALALIGMLAIALPGTVYGYGVFQNVPHLLAWTTLFVAVIPHARGRQLLGWGGLAAAGWWLLFDAQVHNFRILHFNHTRVVPEHTSLLLWAAMAAAFAGGPAWRRALCAALAGAGYFFPADGLALAGITVAAAAAMLFEVRLLPVVVAWAIPTWYGKPDSSAIVACVMMGAAIARLTPPSARSWLPGVAALALGYLGLVTSTGLRTSDLDFNFAVEWLPSDRHLEWWPIVGAALLVKAIVPVVLVTEAIRRWGDDPPIAGPAALAGAIRLAGTALFVAGFVLTAADPPRYRLVELLEDVIAVWLAVAVIQAMAWRWGASSSLSSSPSASPTVAPAEPAVAAAQ